MAVFALHGDFATLCGRGVLFFTHVLGFSGAERGWDGLGGVRQSYIATACHQICCSWALARQVLSGSGLTGLSKNDGAGPQTFVLHSVTTHIYVYA